MGCRKGFLAITTAILLASFATCALAAEAATPPKDTDTTREMDMVAQRLKSGDFTVVPTKLTELAQKNDPRAEFNLAVSYYYGNGIKQDYKKSFEWYQKSAAQENLRATVNLAELYLNGKGTEQDSPKAVALYEKAAIKGDTKANEMLGIIYKRGSGSVKQDLAKAYDYLIEATNGGSRDAEFELADMLKTGNGAPKDAPKALRMLNNLASKGDQRAMVMLGDVYKNGIDVQPDLPRALAWYVGVNQPEAQKNAEEISAKLSPDQMLQASHIIEDIKFSQSSFTQNN